jgi:hypothetical protein
MGHVMMRPPPLLTGALLALALVFASGGELGLAHGSSERAPRVSFRRDVAPTLTASCSTRSCHGGGSRPPVLGPNLDATKMRAALVGVMAEERTDRAYVRPGDPNASFLVQKIEGRLIHAECTDHDCGETMPLDNPSLSPESLRAIRTWVLEGAEDN